MADTAPFTVPCEVPISVPFHKAEKGPAGIWNIRLTMLSGSKAWILPPRGPSARVQVKRFPGVLGTEQVKIVFRTQGWGGVWAHSPQRHLLLEPGGGGLPPSTEPCEDKGATQRSLVGKLGRAPGLLGVDPSRELAQTEKPICDLRTKDCCFLTFLHVSGQRIPKS